MSAALPEGTVFADRYRIVRRIAMGGMGAVYEAVHLETGRRRALKVMHAHMFQSAELRERFKLEARIAAQIESEHIVDVSDAGVDLATEMPFMVMELLRGEELSLRLKRAGPLSPAETIACLQHMAMALDKTHAASIVHRDLKPENIFLCERDDGSVLVKILDFGVAKLLADDSATGGATQSLGTPLYMAPEQFRASIKLTPAADTYALGLLAFTMLVGEAYWKKDARNAGESLAFAFIAAAGPHQPPVERAAELGVTLPPAFDAWFARVTHLDPAERIQPASEVVRTLAEALETPLPVKSGAQLSSPAIASGMTALGPPLRSPQESDPGQFPERTSTGAAITPAARPRRGSLVAAGAAVVVAALAAGAWLGRSTTIASPAPAATLGGSATPPADDGGASAKAASTEPVPTVSPAETATPAPPAVTARPRPPADPVAKTPNPTPRAVPATKGTTKAGPQLLGRD